MNTSCLQPPLDVPANVLDAVHRLNEHARASDYFRKPQAQAIYAYKTFIAAAAATEARPVQTRVKCRQCNGTGIYERERDGAEVHCFRCTKGIALLAFVETRICGVLWYHPISMGRVSGGGEDVLNAVWGITDRECSLAGPVTAVLTDGSRRAIEYGSPEGWGPNMPANLLPADDAARLLNIVEAWLPEVEQYHLTRPRTRWPLSQARRLINQYQLRLDHVDASGCHLCGATYDLHAAHMHSRVASYFDFARPICTKCYESRKSDARCDFEIFPGQPHPSAMTPNVLAWWAHPARMWPFKFESDDR